MNRGLIEMNSLNFFLILLLFLIFAGTAIFLFLKRFGS
jgi:hypothetical protein